MGGLKTSALAIVCDSASHGEDMNDVLQKCVPFSPEQASPPASLPTVPAVASLPCVLSVPTPLPRPPRQTSTVLRFSRGLHSQKALQDLSRACPGDVGLLAGHVAGSLLTSAHLFYTPSLLSTKRLTHQGMVKHCTHTHTHRLAFDLLLGDKPEALARPDQFGFWRGWTQGT